MPGKTAGDKSVQGPELTGRSWLTGKAYRYLGLPIPDEIQDDEVVVLRDINNK